MASLLMRGLVAGLLLLGCLASDSPAGAGPPGAVAVSIATAPGETLAFVPAETTVVAGPVAVSFRNRSSLTHNLVFTGLVSASTRTIVEPGAGDELLIEPPRPGSYPFVCTIHDGMAGVLIVQPSAR